MFRPFQASSPIPLLYRLFCLSLFFVLYQCAEQPSQSTVPTTAFQQMADSSQFHVSVQQITFGPKHHWFGYYDKLEFSPTNRYVLSNQVNFEHRSPRADDVIQVGMIDLKNGNEWIPFGESRAWNWQQGCMLQWLPGSENEVIWNDRQDGQFVAHILNVETGEQRTIPSPVYAVSPDGKMAVTLDFERLNDTRPGYGYAGNFDENAEVLAPENAGIYRVDLETGERELIISIAQMANRLPESDDPSDTHGGTSKHWFNHLLFSPDGERFIFLHRWRSPSKRKQGGFATLMYTANIDGSDIRLVDSSGYTSHFIWRDAEHILAWTKQSSHGNGFYLFKDGDTTATKVVGQEKMPVNGHNTYLPNTNNEWVLNDTYPQGEKRQQQVYLYHIPTDTRLPLGDFYLPSEYKGEWRVDTHPRASRDGRQVVIDCPLGDAGRQLLLLEVPAKVFQ